MPEDIQQKLIEQEMKESYVDYAMSVITARALPDVRDGLKPVHRRILFAMHEMGMHHSKPFKKSARIVGDCLGRYHPHGDMAVYDALVRMAQDFSLRYPLIQGQGNFGSVDGDSPASMRYTEARLARISEEMLADIEKQTVDFVPNFDNSLKEPVVLPARLPNLLVNGSSGIAVAMATSIPPHNLGEVLDACVACIDNPEISVSELLQHIHGPDFPTGGILHAGNELRQAYETGRGKITVRGLAEITDHRIIISEIPYMVNKSVLIESIADLVKNGVISGISDIRDESNREGMRIVVELKKDADAHAVLSSLYRHTALNSTFSIIMIALEDGQPKVMTLKHLISSFLLHRKLVVVRRTQFDLKQAEEKAHILEGLCICLSAIDPVIALIKGAEDVAAAKTGLMQHYHLTELQAHAVLDMKLQKLTSLETDNLRKELETTKVFIEDCRALLNSEPRIFSVIKEELLTMKENYADRRKTVIERSAQPDIHHEDTVASEQVVITLTQAGYIKQTPLSAYKEQRRGGIGVIGTETKEEDSVKELFVAHTKQTLLFFTNKGKVHWLSTWELPQGSRYSKGKAMVNLLQLSENEQVMTVLPVASFEGSQFVVMATKKGVIKKTALQQFSSPRRGGIVALTLDEGDELITTVLTSGQDILFLATKKGNAAKFSESDVRDMGRTAGGVIGIRLELNDEVVGLEKTPSHSTILTVTEKGFGKRTQEEEYRLIHRGGKGVTNIKVTEKNGNVVGVLCVNEQDSVVFITRQGVVLRSPVSGVNVIGRATQGLRLMRPREGDVVTSLAKVSAVDSPDTSMQPGT